MLEGDNHWAGRRSAHLGRMAVCVAAGLLVSACSQSGELDLAAVPQANQPAQSFGSNKSELEKATEYWGKAWAKSPRDPEAALNYARNLKALGQKQQALAVLQQAAGFNPSHRGINSEYGRLALEFDQISVAQKLLEQADDPANPDWRVLSARGTVLAKQGRYREAIPYYEKALTLAPNQASILNNLALAQAMLGHADNAEALLKQAAEAGGHEARVHQNLALVLGLQGKYDEAKLVAARELGPEAAAANVEYVRRIVKLEPRPMPTSQSVATASVTTAETAAGASAAQRPASRTADGWAAQVATAER
jgi:Flp pilus assembly protein TadD